MDPDVPLSGVQTMETAMGSGGPSVGSSMLLVSGFALVALVLGSVGIYGVMAHVVAQREREIGVRMALGALPGEILGLVVWQGRCMVGIGIVLGHTGAWALTRVLTSQLYEVSARDPFTYLSVAALLGAVALAALYLPARRAVRLDPMTSLRSE